ncbi:MAG: NYN domain-containing protein [Armatimonadetes bacterium]|nr:NYN domain-containing protein [Armatimonadota bacterium]
MSVKIESEDEQRRLAVLIDADNALASVVGALLAEVAKFGVASVKRIYGDWTAPHHAQWKSTLLKHSVVPIQQFAYTTGKNATDSALIIDAMDLMYTQRFDGFCLVSSDSDFTRLAQRLREEGLMVYGFGRKQTPDAFVVSCDKFIFTEIFQPKVLEPKALNPSPKKQVAKPVIPVQSQPVKQVRKPMDSIIANKPEVEDFIAKAIEDNADESGCVALANLGSYLVRVRPDFEARNYGHKKLSDLLLKKYPTRFLIEEKTLPNRGKTTYVRIKSGSGVCTRR